MSVRPFINSVVNSFYNNRLQESEKTILNSAKMILPSEQIFLYEFFKRKYLHRYLSDLF